MEDDLGLFKDYGYYIFLASALIYDRLVVYLQNVYGYDLDQHDSSPSA
jgi:hypothetical protein